ncbi:MAG: L-rhamnose isomerase, partial [Bacteroidales bacterium]|nr:L-rhamnose isomerase [Bacteroidales bacterium]
DSDHVVTLNDDIRMIAAEIIRNGFLPRVHIGLDYFDASINRVGAYVTGTRAAQKAFLLALLEPYNQLLELEESGRLFERLALLEELKTKPFGAVWDYYCQCEGVPAGEEYITEVLRYEREANRF